ncbi:MAG: DHH family phosphoesterase, partial [Acidaminococcaceae bacterium]|nr:DHH family phosphoesterase [Acidaminococcaceae bacterium]
ALRMLGKEVIMNVDDDISTVYSFLPGIDEYRRFAPDESVAADLLVIIDASSADRAGNAMEVVKSPAVLSIDHHKTNTRFADYLYLDSDAAATAEIIYSLLLEMGIKLTRDIATCIYEGLYTDTGSFKYSNTTSNTLKTAADLLEYGVNPSVISDNMELKSRSQIEMLRKVLETLTFLKDGKIAYIEIPLELYDHNVETDAFISYPRYVEGVEIALLFKQVEDNLTRVSFRSKEIDVARIALSFGGGGHKKAAGCSIYAPLKEAEEVILRAVGELFI